MAAVLHKSREVGAVEGEDQEAEQPGGSGKTKKGAQRRAAIMAAATELFRDRGFRNTSLDDIGTAAGISGPGIYRYFKGKHELLTVLVEEASITWRATVDDVLSRDTPARETLESMIDAAVALELQNGNLRAVFNQEYRHLDDDARSRVARIDRVTMAEWVHLLCEVNPTLTDEEARAAVIMIDGSLRSVSLLHTSMDRERLAAVMKQMVMGGLLTLGRPDED
jgi:AcrR family transcriptional regulator